MGTKTLKYFFAAATLILSGCAVLQKPIPPKNWVYRENMVFVAGGTFLMGSDAGYEDELPFHEVTLSPFWIGKYQVTQNEWAEVMGVNLSKFKGGNRPAEQMTWLEAVEYCNRRSIRESLKPCYTIIRDSVHCDWSANGYRLPTEAEWEYAARGGELSVGFTYSGSDDLGSVAWYNENSKDKTHEVGKKPPNELGIFDMSGNVFEWCWDWYDKDYYENSPGLDPRGPEIGTHRMLRGGSWDFYYNCCRVSFRNFCFTPYNWNNYVGFRVVRAGL
ncbi:MAG: formylglycine-generating enzyme family protein [Candidatus Cloacimonetes bacterium]|nr:formylglycine-generating enzyme family protein [Candidatus Cloacimonadota bacterium]